MHSVIWGLNVVPTPSIEPINDGSGTSASTQHMTDPISANGVRYGYVGYVSRDTPSNRPLILPVLLGPKGPLTTHVPVDPHIDFNSFSNINAQTSRQQMPSTADVNLTYDLGNSWLELVPAMVLAGHTPNAVISSSSSNEDAGRFVNMPGLMMAVGPPSIWAIPPSWKGNAIADWSETNTRNCPCTP